VDVRFGLHSAKGFGDLVFVKLSCNLKPSDTTKRMINYLQINLNTTYPAGRGDPDALLICPSILGVVESLR